MFPFSLPLSLFTTVSLFRESRGCVDRQHLTASCCSCSHLLQLRTESQLSTYVAAVQRSCCCAHLLQLLPVAAAAHRSCICARLLQLLPVAEAAHICCSCSHPLQPTATFINSFFSKLILKRDSVTFSVVAVLILQILEQFTLN